VYTDLAAALLVRAERHQTPRDLVEAIEVADLALELKPRNEAARFNLALGLERLGSTDRPNLLGRRFSKSTPRRVGPRKQGVGLGPRSRRRSHRRRRNRATDSEIAAYVRPRLKRRCYSAGTTFSTVGVRRSWPETRR
jgi:hypothetical protein